MGKVKSSIKETIYQNVPPFFKKGRCFSRQFKCLYMNVKGKEQVCAI